RFCSCFTALSSSLFHDFSDDHIFFVPNPPPPRSTLFPYTTLFRSEMFRAVDGISFTVGHGESVGLVGESGCGKSTTSMMVMRLLDQTSGRIMFDGEDIGGIVPQDRKSTRLNSSHVSISYAVFCLKKKIIH